MISIVVPVYNEVESLEMLHAQILQTVETLHATSLPVEIIYVDDGSQDGSFEVITRLIQASQVETLHATSLPCEACPILGLQLRRHCGKSAALAAGFDRAGGEIIVTLDADLQDDPAEIPRLLSALQPPVDLVCGWRTPRADGWDKRLASWMFNALARRLATPGRAVMNNHRWTQMNTDQEVHGAPRPPPAPLIYGGGVRGGAAEGVASTGSATAPPELVEGGLVEGPPAPLHDFNSGLKAFRRTVVQDFPLYGEQHRLLAFQAVQRGFYVTEIPVHHRPRRYGHSKYGWERGLAGAFDLLTAVILAHYATRPMHIFGLPGLACFLSGVAICAWLAWERLFLSRYLSNRPLLFLGILLILAGLQFFSLGLLGEMLARMLFSRTQATHPRYEVRREVRS